jgi:uroporphyrin-III C-methyltransferase
MSSHNASHIQARLLGAGRSPATPVVLIENAGRQHARARKLSLRDLASTVVAEAWDGPVLMGIGDAFAYARVAESLAQARTA